MIHALLGAATVVALGFLLLLVADKDVRGATVTVLWALAFCGPFLIGVLVVWLWDRTGWPYPKLRMRRISAETLNRFSRRGGAEGWGFTWINGAFLLVRVKRKGKP